MKTPKSLVSDRRTVDLRHSAGSSPLGLHDCGLMPFVCGTGFRLNDDIVSPMTTSLVFGEVDKVLFPRL